jgi:hypothetical protein
VESLKNGDEGVKENVMETISQILKDEDRVEEIGDIINCPEYVENIK